MSIAAIAVGIPIAFTLGTTVRLMFHRSFTEGEIKTNFPAASGVTLVAGAINPASLPLIIGFHSLDFVNAIVKETKYEEKFKNCLNKVTSIF